MKFKEGKKIMSKKANMLSLASKLEKIVKYHLKEDTDIIEPLQETAGNSNQSWADPGPVETYTRITNSREMDVTERNLRELIICLLRLVARCNPQSDPTDILVCSLAADGWDSEDITNALKAVSRKGENK